ncbi:kinetochore Sim4 complex subunit Fta4 [Biscogniauxia mediterranea]|nr:kinetochore Sim4 complex subunit Fta4 [Biscogniauxia mediterranea]
MAPPTILAHKSTFLTAQTLQLTQALSPSAHWRSANDRADQGGLPDKVVDEALYRLNHVLQQHARRVYAPQASRHVAEQIEGLFLDVGERAIARDDDDDDDDQTGGGAGGGGGGGMGVGEKRLRVGAEFCSDDTIAALPPTWDLHKPAEAEAHPPEASRYADLAASLAALSTRRREVRERVERLRAMEALLAPFKAQEEGDDKSGVQQNLVTRNGELEKELERMRFLLVRVAGRVAQFPDSEQNRGADDDDDDDRDDMLMQDMDVVERAKVDRLLDNF